MARIPRIVSVRRLRGVDTEVTAEFTRTTDMSDFGFGWRSFLGELVNEAADRGT